MVSLDCWGDSTSETCLCLKKNGKFDLFWPFDLTLNRFSLFFVQIKSNYKLTVTIEFFVQNGPWNMCQTTHFKILVLVTFSDLTLTLTWAKYETISLVSTFAWSLGVHMGSFGRKMLRLRSLQSATRKHPISTFDLTLVWHVASILNFRKNFGSVSSRSFECRLVRLSTSIRFWDSTGSDPTPQTVVGSETAQAVAGYTPSFWQLLWKFRSWVMQGQVTRAHMQVDGVT